MSSGKNYKIVHDPVFGRHLVAARDIPPGESIIDEPPVVAGPVCNSNGNSSAFNQPNQRCESELDVCLVCCLLINEGRLDSNFTVCNYCGLKLCSPSCSNDPLHSSQECQIFQKLPSHCLLLRKKTLYNFVIVIRCLYHRIRSREVKWAQVLQLESKVKALEKVGAFTDLAPVFELLKWEYFIDTSTSTSNSPTKRLSELMSSKEDIQSTARHCLGVMRTNAFSSFTNTHAREGLYFLSSLMSHSCVMNTDRQMNHGRMVTRAAVEIKLGEPITTSYLSFLSGMPERFNETRSTWLFTCRCRRCIDPTECGTEMSTMACPACDRLTLQPNLRPVLHAPGHNVDDPPPGPHEDDDLLMNELFWKCANPSCAHAIENCIVPSALEMVQNSRPPITNVSEIEKWLARYENINFLHSNHFLFLQIKFYLCQHYGRHDDGISGLGVEQLRDKVKYSLEILQIFNQLFKGIYIFCGTVLFELWCGLSEIKRRTHKDQKLSSDFLGIDYTDSRINRVEAKALAILHYALPNSAEESMALVLRENQS